MQFSESWLRQFVNPPLNSAELSHLLTMSGLEVEEMRPAAPPFASVVIAEILETTQHPDADRLRVCKVSVGDLSPQPLQIVCGAPNARVGIKIPCAMVGALLPPATEGGKPFAIKIGKLRGVESFGMLCSGRELGLGEDHEGILELPLDAPVGGSIREYLHLDDTIFTIKLTPNKADCLSILGIAREVAALTGVPLEILDTVAIKESIPDTLKVHLQAPDLCGRFSGRIVRGVNAKAVTPDWMVRRLESAGQRSISALVDISNYVMLEVGQPTHVFDLDQIHGDITVRWGAATETVQLLNGQTIRIGDTNLPLGVVADQQGIESLAGVMGGQASSVTLETQNIYLESAFWWPKAIQGRARALNFSTDAAYRFERGVDPTTTVKYLNYLTQLILDICGGKAGPLNDQIQSLPEQAPIELRVARVAKIIGIEITANQIAEYFDRLSFAYTRKQPGTPDEIFVIEPPAYRFDLAIEEDLIEEIARMYGFENIPEIAPLAALKAKPTLEQQRSIHTYRHTLAALGYQEVVNYGFIDAKIEEQLAGNFNPIKVLNPLAEQFAVMRSNLLGSLLNNLKTNVSRKVSRLRIFEIGRVFEKDSSVSDSETTTIGQRQTMMIGGMAYGSVYPEQWGQKGSNARNVHFFDIKADLEQAMAPLILRTTAITDHPAFHPGRAAQIEIQNSDSSAAWQKIGVIGELHPKWQQLFELSCAPILFEVALEAISKIALPCTFPISKFPAVKRDLALVMSAKTPAAEVLAALQQAASALVKDIVLFDDFRPSVERPSGMSLDEKSLAFRITLESAEQTMQDQDVEKVITDLLAKVLVQFSARLR